MCPALVVIDETLALQRCPVCEAEPGTEAEAVGYGSAPGRIGPSPGSKPVSRDPSAFSLMIPLTVVPL
jgi:hypothetical protein